LGGITRVRQSQKILFYTFLLLAGSFCYGQTSPATIKVRKESNLSKAVFDNTQPALVVMDRFGNPVENEIVNYTLYIKYKGDTKAFEGFTNKLSPDMVNYLKKTKKASKLFFTGIQAKDNNGHLVKLPDVIEVWFPDCKSCER
jgi:hypothetical protein